MLTIVKPNWQDQGRDWPNRGASRFVEAARLRWHVQIMGAGPVALLLHGAGAATHSWRDLAPLLARDFTVVAPDLPGHGFTATPDRGDGLSLPSMADSVAALMTALGLRADFAIGHSAGAAIAMRMRLDGVVGEGGIVALNGALAPFPGVAGQIFPAMAKMLFLNPLAIHTFAWRASRPGAVARLLESTGSRIDQAGVDYYARLLGASGHIDGALGMMAHWDLHALRAQAPNLPLPLTLVAADNDRAVPPRVSQDMKAIISRSTLIALPNLGHLAHEEAPEQIAAIIRRAALASSDANS